jgi:hypothetical protein
MTKVEIDSAGHRVTVDAADADLDTAAAKALELWNATSKSPASRGPAAAGFITERSSADGLYTSGHDSS